MKKMEDFNRLNCFIYGFPTSDGSSRSFGNSPLVLMIVAPIIISIPILFWYPNPLYTIMA